MTVLSDGSYEIPEGMFAAFPVKISGLSKKIEIVKVSNRTNRFKTKSYLNGNFISIETMILIHVYTTFSSFLVDYKIGIF